jgi:hypothetical protein
LRWLKLDALSGQQNISMHVELRHLLRRSGRLGSGFFAIGTVCVGLAGCLVPVPPLPYRQEATASALPDDSVTKFPVGKTTRADVMRALGAPNAEAADGSWIVYSDRLSYGKWHLYALPSNRVIDLIPAQGASETIRYRNVIFAFDAYGRVFEVIAEAGYCTQELVESACFGTENVDDRLALRIDAGVLQTLGDRVRGRFIPAAWREGGRWIEGALVLTEYDLVFVSMAGAAAEYRPLLRLPWIGIRDVELGAVDTSVSSLPTAVLTLDGGRQEVFDLGGTVAPPGAVPAVSYQRLTEQFVDSVRSFSGVRR